MFVMWGIVYNWRKIDCLQSKCRKAASARPSVSETSSDVINVRPKLLNSDKEDTQPHGSLEKQHTQGGRKMIGGLSPSLFDRGRAADARPKVGRRRRRRSPNISCDLILSPQFLLHLQSSLRSQTKSQLVAERAQTQHTRSKQVRESEAWAEEWSSSLRCYEVLQLASGYTWASGQCHVPPPHGNSRVWYLLSDIWLCDKW